MHDFVRLSLFVLYLFWFVCHINSMHDNGSQNLKRRKSRAALSNAAGRFDLGREEVDDGWHQEEAVTSVATEIRCEMARSLISYNRSPDLPFDRSINPYRGCEHEICGA